MRKHVVRSIGNKVTGCVFLLLLIVLIVAAEYTVWEKGVLILCDIAIFATVLSNSSLFRNIILCIVTIILLGITGYLNVKVYFPYFREYSQAYNSQTGFAGTQISYAYNTGNSDRIIPTLIRDKTVYIDNSNELRPFIEGFSSSTVILDNSDDVKSVLDDLKELCVDCGRSSICGEATVYAIDSFVTGYSEARTRLGDNPHLYVSENSVDAERIIFIVDTDYNAIIVTFDEYEAVLNEKGI